MRPRPNLMLSILLSALVAVLSLAAAAQNAAAAHSAQSQPAGNPAAIVNNKVISATELDDAVQGRLIALKSKEYELKRQALEDKIDHILLENEAARQGMSLEQFTQKKIEGVIDPPTDDQLKAVYESTREQYKGKTEAEALKQISENLRRARIDLRRSELLKDLRSRAKVQVFLEPPRVKVASDDTRSSGPANAPVTIVEFADFQCPFCGRSAATLKQLQQKYPGRLRLVFRDFPLPIHPNAPKAAEAASCANEQGKFWEMYDKLFANQASLAVADLKRYAAQIGLNADRFDHCLDSGRFTEKWKADQKEGQSYGIGGTPTFFINGRMLVGAAPYDNFAQVIDEELERPATSKTPAQATVTTRSVDSPAQARF